MTASLNAGETLDVNWLEATNVNRQQNSSLPQGLVSEVFRMPNPDEGESQYRAVTLSQDVAVIALDDVSAGEDNDQIAGFVAQMAEQLRAQAVIQGLIDTLYQDADIKR